MKSSTAFVHSRICFDIPCLITSYVFCFSVSFVSVRWCVLYLSILYLIFSFNTLGYQYIRLLFRSLFHQIRSLKHAFPNIFNLVTIAITMPVSSTTCERTFSPLNLIKTFVRNKMGDDRPWSNSIQRNILAVEFYYCERRFFLYMDTNTFLN